MSNRPVGPVVSLPPAKQPSPITLEGRTITLVPLRPDHAEELFPLVGGNDEAKSVLWDYMSDGPFNEFSSFKAAVTAKSSSADPFYFAVIDDRDTVTKGQALGYLSLMNIVPSHLSIEIGNVLFSPALQRTICATEAVYLLLNHAIEVLGYRRVEWKCNALNAPSQRAASRLGFTFEGTFRQHMVIKGRNRDTAWFSLLRDEWEDDNKRAMQAWLEEDNFDQNGQQKTKLEELFKKQKQAKNA